MTIRRAARALFALSLAAAACLTGTAAHAQGPTVALTLLSQTPWSTSYRDPTLEIVVAATNTGSTAVGDLSVGLTIGPNFSSRDQYEASLVEGPAYPVFATTFPFRNTLPAGEVRTFPIAVDLSTVAGISQTDSFVYPAEVDLRSGGEPLVSFTTPVLYLVRQPERPVPFSWWTELAAPVVFAPDGRLQDPTFEAALAPGGSLAAPVDALRAMEAQVGRPDPIDVVIEPSLLDQVGRMAQGYTTVDGTQVAAGQGGAATASAFLASLTDAADADDVQISSMPFTGPSIPAMLASQLGGDLLAQHLLGRRLVAKALGVRPEPSVARPPTGALSPEALDWLGTKGASTLLADADTVEPPLQPGGFAPPATATVAGRNGNPVTLVLPDPGTQRLLESPDLLTDPVRAAQAVLGELAVIWKEEPVPPDQPNGSPTVRGLALRLPSSLPAGIWGPLLDRLGDAPFLAPSHAQDLVALVNPPGADAVLRAPSTDAFPFDYAAAIRGLHGDIAAYASMLTQESTVPSELRRNLRYAESSAYLFDPVAGQPWLDAVAATTQAAFQSTTPKGVDQTFTFTSGEGTIPLRMGDPGPIPLKVTVMLESSQFTFPDGDRQDIVLERPNQIVSFRVVAKTSGQNPIKVVVLAPSGHTISEDTLTVRSTAVNEVALWITLGAAGGLGLLWWRRWVRRRKRASS